MKVTGLLTGHNTLHRNLQVVGWVVNQHEDSVWGMSNAPWLYHCDSLVRQKSDIFRVGYYTQEDIKRTTRTHVRPTNWSVGAEDLTEHDS